jgi:hypothetical protein
MAQRNIYHLAINPVESIEPGLVKKVSEILKKDAYEARLLLLGKIPRIIAHFDSEEKCQQAIEALSALGIFGFAVDDSDLHSNDAIVRKFSAYSLILEDGQVTFVSKNGVHEIVNQSDVYLIIFGKLQRTIILKETRENVKINLTATLLTGGIPVLRKSRENIEQKTFQTEYFIRLYPRIFSRPVIEISESNFNFSFLGIRISPSSAKNIQALIVELKSLFPGDLFDNRLAEYAPVIEQGEVELACKLIYLYHRAKKGSAY